MHKRKDKNKGKNNRRWDVDVLFPIPPKYTADPPLYVQSQ